MNKPVAAPETVRLPMEALSPLLLDCLAQGQEVVLPVTGNSMTPFLRHGQDQVVLAACDATALRRGDVPLYRRESGQYVLHRIVRRVEKPHLTYIMLGDAQWIEEPGIAPEQVLACAVGFVRDGKRYSCRSLRYRLRVGLWQLLRPCRRWLMAVWRRIG